MMNAHDGPSGGGRGRPSGCGGQQRGGRGGGGGRDGRRGGAKPGGPARDRAGRRDDRRDAADQPDRPWRPPVAPRPARPSLPDERPNLPRGVWRELKSAAPAGAGEDLGRAVGAAGTALAEGDTARAVELLVWAKSVAPRSPAVREALGIAFYAAGQFGPASSELLAYRRMSGRQDQNHLLADCSRALDKPDRIAGYVEAMVEAEVDPARVAEGRLVQAGERADRGDLEGALEVLRSAGLEGERVEAWHPRLWYVAGDVSERLGRTDEARDYFESILAVDEEFPGVAERLEALG